MREAVDSQQLRVERTDDCDRWYCGSGHANGRESRFLASLGMTHWAWSINRGEFGVRHQLETDSARGDYRGKDRRDKPAATK